ncbi:DUF3850 domain-containing protein [Faecalicatena sp. BF-R-105]|nr:DUF3850 domain-containing protein [Faecalicatena sp. BF-R-105]DAY78425.1 MAG TPA: activating signal cointegrator [Caudoviricetes sp.]
MEYTQITLNDWMEMKQKLKQELLGVKQSFVRIGYALRKIDDAKLYEQDGYKSVAEFAKAEYGLEGSTVSRFMSINREYSIDGYSERLKPEYADFNRSQLEEMLKLPEADREMITPDTARKEIRDIKKFNHAEPQEGIADDVTDLIRHFGKDNADTLKKLYQCGIADNLYENINRLIEIVNPGGSRSYRKGLFFLMFHEDCLKYKKYGQTPQRMEYREFFERILDVFGDEPEEETMEGVTEAEHERTDSEHEREVEELAAEPQRDSRVEREDPERGEHEQERTGQPDPKVEEPEKTVISPAKKTEEKEETVPEIIESETEIEESVPKIMENVVEIEEDVPEISENVIETEVKVTHQIKLGAEFFDDAAAGRKSFELRKNDRNYKEGDMLEMEEIKDGKKTGRKCSKRIVYMMENFEGLENGYCILGCELL